MGDKGLRSGGDTSLWDVGTGGGGVRGEADGACRPGLKQGRQK